VTMEYLHRAAFVHERWDSDDQNSQ